METFPFRLRLTFMALLFGASFVLISAVASMAPFADHFIPITAFAVMLVMTPVVFPEIRSFLRSGAGMFAWLALSAVIFLTTPAVTFAQEIGETLPVFDIGSIFTSVGALAAFLVVLTQFIRAQIWKTLDGKVLVGFVFLTGLALALAGFYMKLLPAADVFAAVAFGLGAAVAAIGTVNLYKSRTTENKTVAPPTA